MIKENFNTRDERLSPRRNDALYIEIAFWKACPCSPPLACIWMWVCTESAGSSCSNCACVRSCHRVSSTVDNQASAFKKPKQQDTGELHTGLESSVWVEETWETSRAAEIRGWSPHICGEIQQGMWSGDYNSYCLYPPGADSLFATFWDSTYNFLMNWCFFP